MSGEISKDAFVIYLFVYMLCLLTVFNYLWDFHSGGPLWVFYIFGEKKFRLFPFYLFQDFRKITSLSSISVLNDQLSVECPWVYLILQFS